MSVVVKPIALRYESSYGTPTGTRKYLRVRGCNISANEGVVSLDDNVFSRKGAEISNRTQVTVSGSIPVYCTPDDIGYWLYLSLGSVQSSLASGESIVYEHIFNQAVNIPSVTIERDEGVKVKQNTGLKVDNFRFSSSTDIIEAMFSMLGKDVSDGSAYTPSVDELDPFVFSHANIRISDTLTNALLASGQECDNWSLEYYNSLKSVPHVMSRTISRLGVGMSNTSGAFQVINESDTYEDQYREGTERAMVIDLIGSAIGVSSNYRLQFRLPRVKFTMNQKPYDSNNLILETIQFKALKDSTEDYTIQARLYNLTSSYN